MRVLWPNRCPVGRAWLPAALLAASPLLAAVPRNPYEDGTPFRPANRIDELVLESLSAQGVTPANRCSDAVFVRRVHLDVIGALPEPKAVTAFLRDEHPDKRAHLIGELLAHDAFDDVRTLKWCDLLRVKAEFPINLWPNGVQAYARWIHDAMAGDMPYDEFARRLLTSSGSNFRVPPVNFFRGIQGDTPAAIAAAVALTFMGTRIEHWPEDRRAGLEALFSRVAFKGTAEWKEVIVFPDPAATGPLKAVLPDGEPVRVGPYRDPRAVFADWLIAAENPWFARSVANRVWSWLLGRGLVHEPDDIRPDNPPVHPRVLEYLSAELVRTKYDLGHLYRLILLSSTYQQSSVPLAERPDADALFACYPARRLDAEVLLDALRAISGQGEEYMSMIPEPFTFIPKHLRAVELVDGSITSPFLKQFGRPARDTGFESEPSNEPSGEQRLHLLNSSQVRSMIEKSGRLRRLMRAARGDVSVLVDRVYVTILSRHPTADEQKVARAYFEATRNGRNAAIDLVWALVNSKEFLYRH